MWYTYKENANIHVQLALINHSCTIMYFSIRLRHYSFLPMGEEKPDTLDFVKDFQEYLSQQTQHVNMISGSVSGVKEVDELPAGKAAKVCVQCHLLDESSFTACSFSTVFI